MEYLCLIRAETVMEQMSESRAEQHFEEYRVFTEDIRRSGQFVGCNRLLMPDTATTVRVRDGKVSATDGPTPRRRAARRLLPDRSERHERRDRGRLPDTRRTHRFCRGAAGRRGRTNAARDRRPALT